MNSGCFILVKSLINGFMPVNTGALNTSSGKSIDNLFSRIASISLMNAFVKSEPLCKENNDEKLNFKDLLFIVLKGLATKTTSEGEGYSSVFFISRTHVRWQVLLNDLTAAIEEENYALVGPHSQFASKLLNIWDHVGYKQLQLAFMWLF